MLLLVIANGGADGVFGQYAAMDLHGRQAQLRDDVGVLDFHCTLDRHAFQNFSRVRAAGNR